MAITQINELSDKKLEQVVGGGSVTGTYIEEYCTNCGHVFRKYLKGTSTAQKDSLGICPKCFSRNTVDRREVEE